MNNVLKKMMLFPGFRTNRRIVVIESDDWGSIRMPSIWAQENLKKNGVTFDESPFLKFDSLESSKDIKLLINMLYGIRDKNDNPAKITMNFIMTNPNFKKILDTDFLEYHYEPFYHTYNRYDETSNTLNTIFDGMRFGVFQPQFHGREHLNVARWIDALKTNKPFIRFAFDNEIFDLSKSNIPKSSFMDNLHFRNCKEYQKQQESLLDGLELFESVFKFKSKSFIAPRYTWAKELNKFLYDNGIAYFQGNWFQNAPYFSKKGVKTKSILHYTGQQNKLGQIYLVRNSHFEPAQINSYDWQKKIIFDAKLAFSVGKPLIISTHRINFIGSLDSSNRDRNLQLFENIISSLINHWPEIEFLSSDQLGDFILSST